MDSLMQILISIFSPQVFWPIVGVLSISSIIVIIFSFFSDNKTTQIDSDVRKKIAELSLEISNKDTELKSLKDKSGVKEVELRKQLTRLEELINENEASKLKIKTLEATLKEKEEILGKGNQNQEEAEKKNKEIQSEIERIKKETTLKIEMYNGLKSQYDELEGQITDKAKKLQEEQDKNKKSQEEIAQLQKKLADALKGLNEVRQEKKSTESNLASAVKPELENLQEPEKKEAPQLHVPRPDKGKVQASTVQESLDKTKQPPKSDAKVRLAQVMQEAAKVAAKLEEKKKSEEEKKNIPPAPNVLPPDNQQGNQPGPAPLP